LITLKGKKKIFDFLSGPNHKTKSRFDTVACGVADSIYPMDLEKKIIHQGLQSRLIYLPEFLFEFFMMNDVALIHSLQQFFFLNLKSWML
jgi:hypothetical protein